MEIVYAIWLIIVICVGVILYLRKEPDMCSYCRENDCGDCMFNEINKEKEVE